MQTRVVFECIDCRALQEIVDGAFEGAGWANGSRVVFRGSMPQLDTISSRTFSRFGGALRFEASVPRLSRLGYARTFADVTGARVRLTEVFVSQAAIRGSSELLTTAGTTYPRGAAAARD